MFEHWFRRNWNRIPLRNRNQIAYFWAWILLVLVTAGWAGLYSEFLESSRELIEEYPLLEKAWETIGASWLKTILGWTGGLLIWWRIIKVIVLHGSPFPFGIKFFDVNPQNVPAKGVTVAYIGNLTPTKNAHNCQLLYGAVFLPHARSAKLVRSRLHFFTCALLGRTIRISKSRFSFRKVSPEVRVADFQASIREYV